MNVYHYLMALKKCCKKHKRVTKFKKEHQSQGGKMKLISIWSALGLARSSPPRCSAEAANM